MVTVHRVILDRHGQLGETHKSSVVILANDITVDDIQIQRCLSGQSLCMLQNLFLKQRSRLADGETCHVGLARCVSAKTRRRDIRILAGHDINVAVAGEADGFGGHLRIRGIRALTDLRLAALHCDRSVEIQQHAVGRGLERNRVNARVVPERCQADAAADRAGVICILRTLLLVIHVRGALGHALAIGVVEVLVLGESVHEALRHDVLIPEFHRVHADCLGAVFDIGLVCK